MEAGRHEHSVRSSMTQCMMGSIDLDFGYTFRVERFIAVTVPSQVILIMVCSWGVS